MWIEKNYLLTSQAPLILHNGQTADPMNHYAKMLKVANAKRAKTDADYEEISHIEFLASLYLTNNEDGELVPCLPADNLQALLITAAKKMKNGVQAKSGVYVARDAIIDYDGPRDAKELYLDERFRFLKSVCINRARVMRMRPIFKTWSFHMKVMIEDKVINPSRVLNWLDAAGTEIGCGDWRPMYGRFTVAEV